MVFGFQQRGRQGVAAPAPSVARGIHRVIHMIENNKDQTIDCHERTLTSPSLSSLSRMSHRVSLLHLYRRLLRSAETYPSMKRREIYEAIREEFRENSSLDPENEKTKQKIAIAQQGLAQLRQFDEVAMTGGGNRSSWNVSLTQNPMPRPPEESK